LDDIKKGGWVCLLHGLQDCGELRLDRAEGKMVHITIDSRSSGSTQIPSLAVAPFGGNLIIEIIGEYGERNLYY
jgi:hypothetical protein